MLSCIFITYVITPLVYYYPNTGDAKPQTNRRTSDKLPHFSKPRFLHWLKLGNHLRNFFYHSLLAQGICDFISMVNKLLPKLFFTHSTYGHMQAWLRALPMNRLRHHLRPLHLLQHSDACAFVDSNHLGSMPFNSSMLILTTELVAHHAGSWEKMVPSKPYRS